MMIEALSNLLPVSPLVFVFVLVFVGVIVIVQKLQSNLPPLPLLNRHLDAQLVLDLLQTHAGHAREIHLHLIMMMIMMAMMAMLVMQECSTLT